MRYMFHKLSSSCTSLDSLRHNKEESICFHHNKFFAKPRLHNIWHDKEIKTFGAEYLVAKKQHVYKMGLVETRMLWWIGWGSKEDWVAPIEEVMRDKGLIFLIVFHFYAFIKDSFSAYPTSLEYNRWSKRRCWVEMIWTHYKFMPIHHLWYCILV